LHLGRERPAHPNVGAERFYERQGFTRFYLYLVLDLGAH
jgi:hypothetical protein